MSVLVADYEAAREDQRQDAMRAVTLVSAAIAIFAAYFFLVIDKADVLKEIPVVAAILPLAPYMIGVTHTIQSLENILRGYYLRSLERAIQDRVHIASGLGDGIGLPSYGHLVFAMHSPRTSAHRVKFLSVVAWSATLAVYGGAVGVSLLMLPTLVDKVVVGAMHAGLAVALLWTLFTTSVRARPFFLRTFATYQQARAEALDRPLVGSHALGRTSQRSGWSYLALPRIAELIKWAIFLIAWAATTIAVGATRPYDAAEAMRSVELACLFLIGFEFLVYQARYQWNDLRGIEQDRIHVAASVRGRLPAGWERASLAILVLRMVAAAYMVHLVFRGTDLLAPAYAAMALPFLIALPYEELRRASDGAAADFAARPRPTHVGIYAIVGLGFGVRAVAGVLVGSLFHIDWLFLTLFFIAVTLAASAETVAAWAFEAAVEHARGARNAVRPHVASLHRYLAVRVARMTPSADVAVIRTARYLRHRDVLVSPWVALHLTGITVATMSGLVLGGLFPPTGRTTIALTVGTLIGWLLIGLLCKIIDVLQGVIIVVIATAAAMAMFGTVGGGLSAFAPLPPFGVLVVNLFNRLTNFDEKMLGVRSIGTRLATLGRKYLSASLRWAFGRHAAGILFGQVAVDGDSSEPTRRGTVDV